MNKIALLDFINTEDNRLDKILVQMDATKSRSYWQKIIQDGCVLVDDKIICKANVKIKQGAHIYVKPLEDKPLAILPENKPLDIIYQDNDVAVINKAIGMVVHPSAGHQSGTVVNAILFHIKDLSSINGVIRPGIVHRIDKDTSGLLIIAKNNQAHLCLSEQLKDKSLYREYLALVHGHVKDDKFTIDMPIARHPQKRKQMAVVEHGKLAKTHVEVIKRYERYTLVRCRLETGRTHQIRVHLQSIGYPIVGDPIYSSKKDEFQLGGQFLHAYKLGFIHPTTQKQMRFEAPLPTQFEEILKSLT